MAKHTILLIISLWTFSGFAQPDSIKNLRGISALRELENYCSQLNYEEQAAQLPILEAIYKQQNETELEHLAWLIRHLNIAGKEAPDFKKMIAALKPMTDLARKKGWPDVEGELWMHIGQLYFGIEEFEDAFAYSLRALDRFKSLNFGPRGHLYRHLPRVALHYYTLGDWETSLHYYNIYEQSPPEINPKGQRFLYRNTMALAHKQMLRYDSALYWFEKAKESADAAGDRFWSALTRGNIGHTYYLQGDYARAEPLMEQDYAASKAINEVPSFVNAGLTLAHVYLLLGRPPGKAAQMLDSLAPYIANNTSPGIRGQWFQNKYLLAKATGKPFNTWADSALYYQQQDYNNKKMQTLANVRRKVEIEQYLSKLNLSEAERKKQITTRNSLVAGIVLLAAIGLLLVNRARIRNEKKLAEAAFENQLAEEKLRNLRNELEQYTLRMREKTMLAEKFAAELESIRKKDNHEDREKEQTMETLLQSSILTEDEWQHFRNLFDKVHPGFLTRLRMRLPDLTPAETRLLVLTKLQLTNKEMTAMLGIGYDAIKKTRQRLRKKLQLSGDESFDDLLDQG